MLTHRFYAGHGPASERDLQRWSGLTLGEIRCATAELATPGMRDRFPLESVELDGELLWFDPRATARTTRAQHAYLLSTFDEAALTYPTSGFARRGHEADRARLVSQSGGGIVVVGGHDVGTFKRTLAATGTTVTITPDVALSAADRDGIAAAAGFLADFHQRPLELRFS